MDKKVIVLIEKIRREMHEQFNVIDAKFDEMNSKLDLKSESFDSLEAKNDKN